MRKKCSLWRNVSCDQLVRIFSTGLLKGVVEICIFHSTYSLILAKEYFGFLGSVSERLSKRKKKKKKVFGCCLMLQLSQCSSWLSKSSSAAWHRPWPCSCTLLSAMAAVLIQQSCSQLFLLFRGKLIALGFFVVVSPPPSPRSFLGHIMLWLVWCFCTVY